MIALNRIICLVLLFVFSSSGSLASQRGTAARPNESPSATACVERYIEACGGVALSEVKTEIRKGTLARGAFGKVPFECRAKAPGKWLYNQTFAWGDQISYGYDGSVAWVQDTQGIERMNPAQLPDLQMVLDIQAPLRMRELFPDMVVKGSEKIGAAEATTIVVKSPQGIGTELAFDRETGLLLRAGDIYFEDYRSVGDVKRPFKIILGRDEGETHLKMTMEVSEIKQNLDVDDSLFELPACVLPLKEPPLYHARKQVEVSGEAMDACIGEYEHPEQPGVIFMVSREKDHLMIERTGWGQKVEIKPQSETDYFIEFLEIDFHFVKNASGEVTHFEFGDRALKARKIK